MLKTLYALQQLEVAEQVILREKKDSPEAVRLRAIKAAFESKKKQYLNLEAELAQAKIELDAYPVQIAEAKAQAEAEQAAIYDGSTNSMKELEARESQSQTWSDKADELESLSTSLAAEIELMTQTMAQLKEEMATQYQEFRAVKSQYLLADEDRQQRLQELGARKEELIKTIPEADLAWFRNEQRRFNGTPIAKLSMEQVCSGCHTMVPPVVFSRTTKGQHSCCETCGRLLFIEDRF